MGMCVTEPDFFCKSFLLVKMTKNIFFGLFRKIYSLVLSGIDVEPKYL